MPCWWPSSLMSSCLALAHPPEQSRSYSAYWPTASVLRSEASRCPSCCLPAHLVLLHLPMLPVLHTRRQTLAEALLSFPTFHHHPFPWIPRHPRRRRAKPFRPLLRGPPPPSGATFPPMIFRFLPLHPRTSRARLRHAHQGRTSAQSARFGVCVPRG